MEVLNLEKDIKVSWNKGIFIQWFLFYKSSLHDFWKKYSLFIDHSIYVLKKFSNSTIHIFYEKNELNIILDNHSILIMIKYFFFHTSIQTKILSDLIIIDYPGRDLRFNLVYNFLNIRYNFRLNLILFLDELKALVTITRYYRNALWSEREVWDMFGIFFFKHPDLRRILTDYSFEGHPLKKDFPLTGYFEVFYDDTQKRIMNIPISLFQEFRFFTFNNPWI